jgi:hypothetical protein
MSTGTKLVAGHWSELKAKQLMMHAALCEHCGPLLRSTRMQYGKIIRKRRRLRFVRHRALIPGRRGGTYRSGNP